MNVFFLFCFFLCRMIVVCAYYFRHDVIITRPTASLRHSFLIFMSAFSSKLLPDSFPASHPILPETSLHGQSESFSSYLLTEGSLKI